MIRQRHPSALTRGIVRLRRLAQHNGPMAWRPKRPALLLWGAASRRSFRGGAARCSKAMTRQRQPVRRGHPVPPPRPSPYGLAMTPHCQKLRDRQLLRGPALPWSFRVGPRRNDAISNQRVPRQVATTSRPCWPGERGKSELTTDIGGLWLCTEIHDNVVRKHLKRLVLWLCYFIDKQ